MFKQPISCGFLATLVLGAIASTATAAPLLLPAVQSARKAAAVEGFNADSDGDGVADTYVWFGDVPNADGDATPVLMVISDQQDFYYQEYGDTRSSRDGEKTELMAKGPAYYGSLDAPHQAAVCYGVSVLAYADVGGEFNPRPMVMIAADDGREPFVVALQLMF